MMLYAEIAGNGSSQVIPAMSGRASHSTHRFNSCQKQTPAKRRAAMTCAQRLERVFGIDIETYPVCG
jgi:hypothetical protein